MLKFIIPILVLKMEAAPTVKCLAKINPFYEKTYFVDHIEAGKFCNVWADRFELDKDPTSFEKYCHLVRWYDSTEDKWVWHARFEFTLKKLETASMGEAFDQIRDFYWRWAYQDYELVTLVKFDKKCLLIPNP